MKDSERLAAARRVEGWFADDEGWRLAELASAVPADLEIVEIGAFAGRSTAFLAAGSHAGNGAHITSLDDWSPAALPGGTDQGAADEVFDKYQANLSATLSWGLVTPLRARSTWVIDYWVKPIGLLFLDATHLYEDTLNDIQAWGSHLVSGGHAAFHDYHPDHPGVIQATDEAVDSGEWEPVDVTRSLRVLRRA